MNRGCKCSKGIFNLAAVQTATAVMDGCIFCQKMSNLMHRKKEQMEVESGRWFLRVCRRLPPQTLTLHQP